jgi:hypothetical protein
VPETIRGEVVRKMTARVLEVGMFDDEPGVKLEVGASEFIVPLDVQQSRALAAAALFREIPVTITFVLPEEPRRG